MDALSICTARRLYARAGSETCPPLARTAKTR